MPSNPSDHSSPPPEAAEFLREILQRVEESWGDPKQVFSFLEKKLVRLDQALLQAIPQVFAESITSEPVEKHWRTAALFVIFGIRVGEFPLGNRSLNIEMSISAYKAALQIYTCNAFPKDWARTQNNLGEAYRQRIQGEQEENLERAIEAYHAALQVLTRDAHMKEWATLNYNLGNAYRDRIGGNRAENLDQAIKHYEAALEVHTRDEFPNNWAVNQSNLGSVYYRRILGSRAENLEQAIKAYEAALQVYTFDATPEQWAMVQCLIGTAYFKRIFGEREQNLEKTIAAYKSALQVYTSDNFPEMMALAQIGLASTLLERFTFTEVTADFDKAIALLESAQSRISHQDSDICIIASATLGSVLHERYFLHHEIADLEQAIFSYCLAADNTPSKAAQIEYQEKAADSQYQLGVALTQEGRWYDGLAHLEASLQTYRQGHNRLARADVLQQMARTHYLMGNFEKALLYFRDALRIYQAEQNEPGEAHCRAGLGRLMLRLNFVDDALTELQKACTLYHKLDDTTRLTELQDIYTLAQKVHQHQPLAPNPKSKTQNSKSP